MRPLLAVLLGWGALLQAQSATPPAVALPTDNHALLEGRPEAFYQFIDRSIGGKSVPVWEGGQFGFVRNPVTLKSGEMVYTRFHEGLDIKPMQRDAKDEPLDEVHAMAGGEVVHASDKPGASNYGRYVVVRHDWADGPIVSLYAHLKEITCTVGQKVEQGTKIGMMGYSGVGIDRRRAHTHVEMGLYLSSRFAVWHDNQTPTLNYHGMWNGLNIVGFDLSKFLLERAKRPELSAAEFIKNTPAHFRVAVPGDAEMELVQHYPWLCDAGVAAAPAGAAPGKPKSWQVSFTAWGLPVKVERSDAEVTQATVVWVQPSSGSVPEYSLTRGLLNGTGDKAKLSNDGMNFIELATGMFAAVPKAATPIGANEAPKPKGKSSPKSSKGKSKAKR